MTALDDNHDYALRRFKLAEPVAPFRGSPIQVRRRPGPAKGYWDGRGNVGPIKVSVPLTKSSIRAGLSRLRG